MRVRSLLAALTVCSFMAPAMAQEAPKGAVSLINPFTVGGLTDLTARFLVDKSKAKFPAGIAVINRPGAGGSIGVTEIVQSKPDGSTVGLAPTASIIDQPQINKLPYKSPDDFEPIINTITYYQFLAVRADAPWKTIQELMDAVRAAPGKIRFGSSGIGTASHLNLAQLMSSAKIDVVHAPFSGWAEGSAALLGGHVDTLIINPGEGRQLVNAGRLRILAAFSPERSKFYPDVPTFKELGHDAAISLSFVVIGPKGLPDATKAYFHDAFKAVLEDESFKTFAASREVAVNYMNSADAKEMVWREFKEHTALLERLGLLAK